MAKENAKKSVEALVANVVQERAFLSQLAGLQFGKDRNIDAVLGYTVNPTIDQYKAMYDRRGLASTIVDAPAKTTWRKSPEVTDGSEGKSDFMTQWEALRKRLSVYHYLERVDRLAGIGRYGVLLIGSKDGNLDAPLESVGSPEDIIFLSTFSESYAKIKDSVTDVNDSRFGHPLTYSMDLGGDLGSGVKKSLTDQVVHWTRVIHIAEGLLENEIYGEPRLQKIYNRLQDLDKIVGSSAEGYWQSAAKGFAIGPKKDWEMDPTGLEEAKEGMQEYIHGLQRIISIAGLEIQELKGEITDPSQAFDVVISLISGKTGIPKRILLGSERGDLASTQDEANWLGRVSERQKQFAEPLILRALIDRLISIKALTAPQEGEYEVTWPGLFYLNDIEQAEVYKDRAEAISTVSGKFPLDFFSIPELREAVGFEPEPEEEKPVTHALDEDDEEVQAEFMRLTS